MAAALPAEPSLVFWDRISCVSAGLKLTVLQWMALNFWFSCLYLANAVSMRVCCYATFMTQPQGIVHAKQVFSQPSFAYITSLNGLNVVGGQRTAFQELFLSFHLVFEAMSWTSDWLPCFLLASPARVLGLRHESLLVSNMGSGDCTQALEHTEPSYQATPESSKA